MPSLLYACPRYPRVAPARGPWPAARISPKRYLRSGVTHAPDGALTARAWHLPMALPPIKTGRYPDAIAITP